MLLANSQTVPVSEGIGIAVTGMLIVFTALMLIATFIAVLPRLLERIGQVFPPGTEAARGSSSSGDFPVPEPDEDELLAAIGFVLHSRNARVGVILLIFGFILQMIGNWFQTPPSF